MLAWVLLAFILVFIVGYLLGQRSVVTTAASETPTAEATPGTRMAGPAPSPDGRFDATIFGPGEPDNLHRGAGQGRPR